MARRPTDSADAEHDPLVPIILRDARTVWLPVYDHGTPEERAHRAVAKVDRAQPILPGLNYRRLSYVRKVGLDKPSSYNVRLEARDPTQLPAYEKMDLVASTGSKDSLRQWREVETDPDVLRALDKRLHG
jgi:hypothetical protein